MKLKVIERMFSAIIAVAIFATMSGMVGANPNKSFEAKGNSAKKDATRSANLTKYECLEYERTQDSSKKFEDYIQKVDQSRKNKNENFQFKDEIQGYQQKVDQACQIESEDFQICEKARRLTING